MADAPEAPDEACDLDAWRDLYHQLGVVWRDPRDTLAVAKAAEEQAQSGLSMETPLAGGGAARDLDALLGPASARAAAAAAPPDGSAAAEAAPPPERAEWRPEALDGAFDELLGREKSDADVAEAELCKRRRTTPTVMWAPAPPPAPPPAAVAPPPLRRPKRSREAGARQLEKWRATLEGERAAGRGARVLRVLKILADSEASLGELRLAPDLVALVGELADSDDAAVADAAGDLQAQWMFVVPEPAAAPPPAPEPAAPAPPRPPPAPVPRRLQPRVAMTTFSKRATAVMRPKWSVAGARPAAAKRPAIAARWSVSAPPPAAATARPAAAAPKKRPAPAPRAAPSKRPALPACLAPPPKPKPPPDVTMGTLFGDESDDDDDG